MTWIIVIISILIYYFVGVIIAYAVTGEAGDDKDGDDCFLVSLFWPVCIIYLLFIGLWHACRITGLTIRGLLFVKEEKK